MPDDLRWLRHAFRLADRSLALGDYAFGCVIVGADGKPLVEAVQSVARAGDWLAHAEMNALHEAARRWRRDDLAGATLYTSTEPCPMCTGAIGWSVSRLVYGLSQAAMYRLFPSEHSPRRFIDPWHCRSLLARVHPPMEIIGPLLEEEGAAVYARWMEHLATQEA